MQKRCISFGLFYKIMNKWKHFSQIYNSGSKPTAHVPQQNAKSFTKKTSINACHVLFTSAQNLLSGAHLNQGLVFRYGLST